MSTLLTSPYAARVAAVFELYIRPLTLRLRQRVLRPEMGCGLPLSGGRAQMPAYVADQVDAHPPLREAPLPVATLEAVVVSAAGDGLQSKSGSGLQHGDVGPRGGRPGR